MNLKIKLIDETLPLPEYKTRGSVAFDLYSRINITVPPKEIRLIPLNVIIGIPDGHFMILAARSSLPIKKGLTCANSIGIVDTDFCGEQDEWRFEAYNFSDSPVTVERGERIAQALLIKFEKAEISKVNYTHNESRGGIGSTG